MSIIRRKLSQNVTKFFRTYVTKCSRKLSQNVTKCRKFVTNCHKVSAKMSQFLTFIPDVFVVNFPSNRKFCIIFQNQQEIVLELMRKAKLSSPPSNYY
jgi:hypothetical protein